MRAHAARLVCLGPVQALGDGRGRTPRASNPAGEGSVPAHDGLFQGRAEVVIAGEALGAMQAASGIPAQADGLGAAEQFGFGARGRDGSDGFVSGRQRILCDLPFVVQHGQVGMADAAVGDIDLDLLVAERAAVGCTLLSLTFAYRLAARVGAERVATGLWRAGRRRLRNWLFGFVLGPQGSQKADYSARICKEYRELYKSVRFRDWLRRAIIP